jgi:signal transduction histidine kinase
VEVCKSRGWRGNEARSTVPGTGTGLWVADRIAESHQGRLVVTPTSVESVTEVSFLLPIGERVTL